VTALLVVVGAAVGAPVRYLVDRVLRVRFGVRLPWGTFAVNVGGSALLGVLAGAAVAPSTMALLGAGFCGALTTYSTFGVETVELAAGGRRVSAAVYALGSAASCLGAAALGFALAAP